MRVLQNLRKTNILNKTSRLVFLVARILLKIPEQQDTANNGATMTVITAAR